MRALLMRLRPPFGARADITGAVIAGYAQMAITALVNILLVPLYLDALGRTGFGLLMMLIGLSAYAGIGVLWLFGGLTRGLGVAFARGARDEFAAAWAAGKWGVLIGAGLVAGVVSLTLWAAPRLLGDDVQQIADFPLVLALFFTQLAVTWLYSIDRLALTVSGRQTVANLLIAGQQLLLGAFVYLALALKGGLAGVMAAFLASHVAALIASSVVRRLLLWKLAWRTPFDPMVRRELRAMLSRQGTAYQVFGMLVLSLQADILVVGLIGGSAIAAEFALVWKIAEITIQGLWRIPEAFQPRIIQLDTMEQVDALHHLLRRVDWLMLPLAVAAAIAYGLFGHWILELWVGAEHAPNNILVYVLAGGAIFWLSLSRLPILAGSATGRLRRLLPLMATEVLEKIVLTAAMIGSLGLLAPLIAINVVHALGLAYGYRYAMRRIVHRKGQ
jgi:O-antigen/teichoic acid export membrane protein